MTVTRESDSDDFVDAVIRFTDPATEESVLHTDDHESSTFGLLAETVRIRNARTFGGPLSFERNGFTLIRHHLDLDLQDKAEVEQKYYPQAAQIIRDLTGASDVIVFLDLIRSEVRGGGLEPANNAHIDFDEPSIHAWVRMQRPDDAERLLKKRILTINLWRGIRPVESMPLAVCDAASVSRGDLIRTVIGHKPGEEPSPFAGFNLAYNPAQRWFYFPDMQPDELLAFKLFDSEMDRPHLTAHTAFKDPESRPGAPPRLSHEVRTIAFID
jgi:hypothetical protein